MQGFTSGGPARETICCCLLVLPSDRIFLRFFRMKARWLSFPVCRHRQVFQEKDEWNLSIRRVLPRCTGAAGSSARSVKGRAPGRPLDGPPQCGTWRCWSGCCHPGIRSAQKSRKVFAGAPRKESGNGGAGGHEQRKSPRSPSSRILDF